MVMMTTHLTNLAVATGLNLIAQGGAEKWGPPGDAPAAKGWVAVLFAIIFVMCVIAMSIKNPRRSHRD